IGSAVLGSLISYYVYFTYGYNGVIVTIFTIISGISAGIIIIYPFLSRKFNRRQLSKICLAMIIFGYAAMLIVGLLWHDKSSVYLIAVCAAFPSIGQGIYYMVLTIGITNTVEYNEFKTGKRDEGIIFSLRPFMAKMASALLMGIIAIVFGILNVADITKAMSNIENSAALGTITSDQKATEIANIIATVPEETKQWLLVCMTVLPIIFLTIAIVIFLRKYKIDETYYGYILKEIDAKKARNLADNSDLISVDNCETEKLDTAENI
ncbi:MAG: MFS transporter, partial [Clostridia bacterium]